MPFTLPFKGILTCPWWGAEQGRWGKSGPRKDGCHRAGQPRARPGPKAAGGQPGDGHVWREVQTTGPPVSTRQTTLRRGRAPARPSSPPPGLCLGALAPPLSGSSSWEDSGHVAPQTAPQTPSRPLSPAWQVCQGLRASGSRCDEPGHDCPLQQAEAEATAGV